MGIRLLHNKDYDIAYTRHLPNKFFFRKAGQDFLSQNLPTPPAEYRRFIQGLKEAGSCFDLERLYRLAGIERDIFARLVADFTRKGLLRIAQEKSCGRPVAYPSDSRKGKRVSGKGLSDYRVLFIARGLFLEAMLKKFISYGLLKRNITCLKLKKEKNGFSAPRLRGLASLVQYSDLVVLCSPKHGSEESFAINKLCLAMRKPWLNVELNEYEAVIGLPRIH